MGTDDVRAVSRGGQAQAHAAEDADAVHVWDAADCGDHDDGGAGDLPAPGAAGISRWRRAAGRDPAALALYHGGLRRRPGDGEDRADDLGNGHAGGRGRGEPDRESDSGPAFWADRRGFRRADRVCVGDDRTVDRFGSPFPGSLGPALFYPGDCAVRALRRGSDAAGFLCAGSRVGVRAAFRRDERLRRDALGGAGGGLPDGVR